MLTVDIEDAYNEAADALRRGDITVGEAWVRYAESVIRWAETSGSYAGAS